MDKIAHREDDFHERKVCLHPIQISNHNSQQQQNDENLLFSYNFW